MSIKLNLGSHNKDVGQDYINIDALDLPNVDLYTDLREIPFKFKVKKKDKLDWDFLFDNHLDGTDEFNIPDNFADEIVMIEVLEHLSFRITHKVLKECHRILKVGGVLKIQVPDCGKAMQLWNEKKVCKCVLHKPLDGKFIGKIDCPLCHGEARLGWQRWLFSFCGAQKHQFDAHLAIFTKDLLDEEIRKAGFGEYKFKENPVKLIVEAIK